MALEIGAAVRIWRSSPEADATRVVRGLILDVAPGLETTSLPQELESEDDPFDVFERERDPLQQLASDLQLCVFELFQDAPERQSSHIGTLLHGVGEIGTGLAQALTQWNTKMDGLQRGLALVQLKRALRGAAFAAGALFPLQADGLLSHEDFEDLQRTLQQLDDGIVGELTRIREERE
jgi:hypothetical protein